MSLRKVLRAISSCSALKSLISLRSENAHPTIPLTVLLRRFSSRGESCLVHVRLTTGELVQVRRNLRESNKSDLPKVNDQVILGLHPNETRIVTGE
uniref:TOBE domain-containing protein n=1 Tax=Agrobacterium fabrum TaxID=1176649 RepID=UPI003965A8CF